ncbi:MAG: hypothetical protein HZC23_06895 [Rhodocyclales bacterium]|nr:hypothetical protein [Rhodocyclales bacterium]
MMSIRSLPGVLWCIALFLMSAHAAAQGSGTALPKVGDSWTYRFSDGYNKSGTYSVRISAVSAEEITDEASLGKARHAAAFGPGLELAARSLGVLPVREISPYFLSLGPFEGRSEWKDVTILSDARPFTARLAGTETVQVPAGSFETRKIVIYGGQPLVGESAERPYTVTVWYAPAVKRFVKLTFAAHVVAGGYFPADRDSVELMEFKVQ